MKVHVHVQGGDGIYLRYLRYRSYSCHTVWLCVTVRRRVLFGFRRDAIGLGTGRRTRRRAVDDTTVEFAVRSLRFPLTFRRVVWRGASRRIYNIIYSEE